MRLMTRITAMVAGRPAAKRRSRKTPGQTRPAPITTAENHSRLTNRCGKVVEATDTILRFNTSFFYDSIFPYVFFGTVASRENGRKSLKFRIEYKCFKYFDIQFADRCGPVEIWGNQPTFWYVFYYHGCAMHANRVNRVHDCFFFFFFSRLFCSFSFLFGAFVVFCFVFSSMEHEKAWSHQWHFFV